jgi:hypothetical protein
VTQKDRLVIVRVFAGDLEVRRMPTSQFEVPAQAQAITTEEAEEIRRVQRFENTRLRLQALFSQSGMEIQPGECEYVLEPSIEEPLASDRAAAEQLKDRYRRRSAQASGG